MNSNTKSPDGAPAVSRLDPFESGISALLLAKSDDAHGRSWAQLIDELQRIRTLHDDWDGEGTDAPDPNLVDGAIQLAQFLEARLIAPADRVIASINGTIYFEWHTPDVYQEIEVTSPHDAEVRIVEKGTNSTTCSNLTYWPQHVLQTHLRC